MRSLLALTFMFILASCAATPTSDQNSTANDSIVIMVGIDGLRWDAIDRHPAPTLQTLAEEGVRAESMTPVMPSLTFVNFYALATGCMPIAQALLVICLIQKNLMT